MEYSILILTFCVSVTTVCAQISGELNAKCRTVGECRNFGYLCAKNRTCQCLSPLYIPNKYGDKCVGLIDQKCKYDDHCIEGAFCNHQTTCKCKENLSLDENGLCSNSNIAIKSGLVLPCMILYYLHRVL
ncbi:uncharacterized protein LOC108917972 [Anoplophora glabripennis]|uniref:uncharacterized protein LOC108917972 n=1 Tax=Anoplophora glabripennis TaxID=217634 RepID=UPI0008742CE1|nr:uncharacterized protein LOC108917972 [Anoplophora glabripennis]XP_018580323.1 uncharacterized protein LOC108917972 [Anoplophora glabripennis]XP_023311525.1 uncharacterized protein LOC108917972 [Anoplophora glabripennis]